MTEKRTQVRLSENKEVPVELKEEEYSSVGQMIESLYITLEDPNATKKEKCIARNKVNRLWKAILDKSPKPDYSDPRFDE